MLCAGVFFLRDHTLTVRFPGEEAPLCKWRAILYGVLFVCCLLTVFRVLDVLWLTILVIVVLLIFSRKLLLRVDYSLLLTFVCFFVFVGNLRQVPAVQEGVSWLLSGREVAASVLVRSGHQQCSCGSDAFFLYGKRTGAASGNQHRRPWHLDCFSGKPDFLPALFPDAGSKRRQLYFAIYTVESCIFSDFTGVGNLGVLNISQLSTWQIHQICYNKFG